MASCVMRQPLQLRNGWICRGFRFIMEDTSSVNMGKRALLDSRTKLFSSSSNASDSGFEIVSDEPMHSRYLKVTNRKVAYPIRDGKQREVYEYDVISSRHPHFCVVFPFHASEGEKGGEVTVLREYCQGLHSLLYSLPAGGFDEKKHASKEECARQELSEEAHLGGGNLTRLIDANHPGIPEVKWCANRFTPFLALNPKADNKPAARDAEEFIEVLQVSIPELKNLIMEGNMLPPSVVTSHLALEHLTRHGFL